MLSKLLAMTSGVAAGAIAIFPMATPAEADTAQKCGSWVEVMPAVWAQTCVRQTDGWARSLTKIQNSGSQVVTSSTLGHLNANRVKSCLNTIQPGGYLNCNSDYKRIWTFTQSVAVLSVSHQEPGSTANLTIKSPYISPL